jgi:hypothetical protein
MELGDEFDSSIDDELAPALSMAFSGSCSSDSVKLSFSSSCVVLSADSEMVFLRFSI